ncbi:BLUF domain-containing protein [Salegentibacter sediminis]|uniref:BLUF domain-containing protein n=1 Tax=Salegentibacter sediminis TaxID=1930251 RepID=UPI0009BF42F3|nr:BLUF domain-containing protein [Salegentibacter sediminis]
MLKYLSYVSKQSHSLTEAALEKMLFQARSSNEAAGITGMLICYEGLFIQYLEGEEGAITRLFEKISKDKRHQEILILDYGHSETRSFADWSMAFERLKPEEAREITGYKNLNRQVLFSEAIDKNHPALQLLKSFIKNL